MTDSSISIKYVEDCYVEVVNNESGLLIERQECSHNFVKDNTYSSQVFLSICCYYCICVSVACKNNTNAT